MHMAAMYDLESRPDFVRKRFAPDALSALAAAGGITGLDHEPFDIAVPYTTVVIS
jgi:hypothetical protein